jgi:hypothetical protein
MSRGAAGTRELRMVRLRRRMLPVLRSAYHPSRVNALADVRYNDGGSSLAGRGRFLSELSATAAPRCGTKRSLYRR